MRRNSIRVSLMYLVVVLAVSPILRAEEPRIGLALSGGGARGAAHVGVLKVLEELKIPVHYVAGTSMGSIVGGLYASGVSPDEMEEILANIEWRKVLDDRPDRRDLPYRRKVDDQTFLTRFEIGFNDWSFQMPTGLISGQELDFAIQALALRTAGIRDFDDLPIPFRAVATDIGNGEMVVLSHGDLGRAVRASMSIPAVFSPVEIDGRLLVDGGVARNLPVDVVRAMGADIVIAVDVGEAPPDQSELRSLTRMTSQLMGLQIWKNVQEQAKQADILVKPELTGFRSTQFEKTLEMVPRGEEAARRMETELARLSVGDAAHAAYVEGVRKEVRSPETIASVQLTLDSTADSDYVFRRIRTRPGDPFDLRAIRRDLRRLYQSGDYEKVSFFLTRDGDDYALHIEAHEKPWGPNVMRFGLNLFADFEGESSFDIQTSYSMTRLNRLRGELKFDLQVGEDPTLRGEFYQPLSLDGTWFVAPWVAESTMSFYAQAGEGLLAHYKGNLLQGGLDLGYQMGKYGEVRLGVMSGRGKAELQRVGDTTGAGSPGSDFDIEIGGYRAVVFIDQFDNMNFPRDGYLGVLSYYRAREKLGADTDYQQAELVLGGALARDRHSGMAFVNLYSALGSESPASRSLGGLFNLSGYAPGEIVGREGGTASLLYLYRLAQLSPGMGDGIYIGVSVEAGNLWHEREQAGFGDLRYGGSLFVGIDTALGPLYFAQGFADDGSNAFYVYVGRSF